FEFMHLTIEDTIETTGRAFLGLTLRCARCHDHKFDPVTMEDYYGLYGFFASTLYPYAGSEELQSKNLSRTGFVSLLPPDEATPLLKLHEQEIERIQAEIKSTEQDDPLARRVADLKKQIEAKSREIREHEAQKETPQSATKPEAEDPGTLKAELARLQKEHDEANAQLQSKLKPLRDDLRRRQRPGLPHDLPGAYAVREAQPADSHIQVRGNPADQGRVVSRCPPRFLVGDQAFVIPAGSSGRLELARWITRPDHPLTARVMVNRIWQHHLGNPIVGTPSNFGLRGDRPTHPALLDWLAARFVESGWSIKAMHRQIMLSQTYQLASTHNAANAAKDPANRWCWRFERRRLDAEAIRDAMLAVGGNLELGRPGPHPFPPIEQWNWTQHQPFKAVHPGNHRSVYLMTQRIQRHPYLALFDGPDTNYSTDVRTSATVPLQALFMMNNPFVYEQARGFARRLITESPDAGKRIELAHRLAWGRRPQPVEVDRAVAYLDRYIQELARAELATDQRELEAWTSYARVLLTANEFVYLD
ncbi:MAG: DUF1553 domain-containing protein, partial [Planctomycetes bacterium]|nr:DUF1553 domain-containing protein [Planctomycetota bacterium]